MVLSVDSGGAEPVSHDVVELSHSLSQAIPSLCVCLDFRQPVSTVVLP